MVKKMMFFKLVRYDFVNGTVKQYKKYLLSLIFFLSLGILYRLSRLGVEEVTYGNYILNVFVGIPEYIPSTLEHFKLPIIWICFYLFSCFTVLYYPYNDISDLGKSVLINSGKRSYWFFSKCCWTVFSVLIYFLLFYFSQMIICLLFSDSFSPDITQQDAEYYFANSFNLTETYLTHIPVLLYVLPFFVNIAICLFQLTMSLLVKPMYSYIVSSGVLVISVYYTNRFAIGNYAMILRSQEIMQTDISADFGIIICAVISLISIIFGIIVFDRYDILSKE